MFRSLRPYKSKQTQTSLYYRFFSRGTGPFSSKTSSSTLQTEPYRIGLGKLQKLCCKMNTTSKVSDIKRLIGQLFERITPGVWTKCEDHVRKIEDKYWKDDLIEESTIQPVLINFESDDPYSEF